MNLNYLHIHLRRESNYGVSRKNEKSFVLIFYPFKKLSKISERVFFYCVPAFANLQNLRLTINFVLQSTMV